MMFIVLTINYIALVVIFHRGLPQPFPWKASVLLAIVLLIGGFTSPLGRIERGVGFVTLLSSVIVTLFVMSLISDPMAQAGKLLFTLSILLTLFILADAFRLFHTPDVAMTPGETFALFRRPYLFEHPNLKASWLLLLSLSSVSFAGIIFAQSRGALMGYMAALFRYVPKRFYIHALVIGMIVITVTAFLRPGTFFGRVDLWRAGVDMFMSHPITGFGTGSYLLPVNNGMVMTTAHNAALTIAAENGLIGLTAFIAWIIGAGVLIARSSHVAKYNLLAFSVQQIVDDQWLHPVSAILLGVVLAVCLFQLEK